MWGWVVSIGLEPSGYGTHSMRRTKVAQMTGTYVQYNFFCVT